eukprot:gene8594-7772_t
MTENLCSGASSFCGISSSGSVTGNGLSFKQMMYCFFVSIATILGTGILALPVKLYQCGFAPFVVTFSFALIAQVGVVCLMVEVLQRASQFATTHADGRKDSPSLHSLASLYLTGALRHIFNVSAMVHFVSLLIGYVLAWSKAFCQVCFAYNFQTHIALFQSSATEIQIVGCTDSVVITPFVIVFSTALVLLNRQLQPLVTTLTFIKCVMLIVMVVVVGYIGSEAAITPSSSWAYMGSPFLIGTIALGGVVNVMPVLYEQIPKTKTAILHFRTSVTAGVVVCWTLNVLWLAWKTVPMSSDEPCHQISSNGTATLECAHNVSYLTIGNAMKHMIDGYSRAHPPSTISGRLASFWSHIPESLGVETVLEVVTSLALNIEAGAGVGVMFFISRNMQASDTIANPLSPIWDVIWVPVTLFFVVAVFYDIFSTTLKFGGISATIAIAVIGGVACLVYSSIKCYYRSCTPSGILGVGNSLGHRPLPNDHDDVWNLDISSSDDDGQHGISGRLYIIEENVDHENEKLENKSQSHEELEQALLTEDILENK